MTRLQLKLTLIAIVLFLGSGGGLVKGLLPLTIVTIIWLRALQACLVQWWLSRRVFPFLFKRASYIAAFWILLANSFFVWGVAWGPIGYAFLYSCSGPVYTAALAWLFDKRKPSGWERSAMLALVGVASYVAFFESLALTAKLGVLWAALAGFFLAMFLRSQENVFPPERRAGSVVLANAVVAYIGIMLIPTGIVDLFALAHATPRMWLYIVALGVCQSGLGFRWMAIAQGQIGRKVAYCVILASLVAPFMGLILANDQPNMSEYCIALVIHGMVAMAVRDSLRAAPARR